MERKLEELKILEKLPDDEHRGNRRHAWVVILSNVEWAAKKSAGLHHQFDDVTPIQPFFIEPSTGFHFSADDSNYFAIDSVWHEGNYYVSYIVHIWWFGQFAFSIEHMIRADFIPMIIVMKGKFARAEWRRYQKYKMGFGKFEKLATPFKWEFSCWFWEAQWNARSIEKCKYQLLCTVSRYADQLAEAIFCDECRQVINKLSIIKYFHFLEKCLHWTCIRYGITEYDERYPNGCKEIYYKRVRLELFAPYLNDDGVVKRLTQYTNLNYTDEIACWQWYRNREDSLETIEKDFETNQIIENYATGRSDSLRRKYLNCIFRHFFCVCVFLCGVSFYFGRFCRFHKIYGWRRWKNVRILR